MKVLITGGSGFIGTHLIKLLLDNLKVDYVLNLDLKHSEVNDDRLETQIIDIRSINCLSIQSNHNFDYCIHLAALCKEPGYEWEEYFQTNHEGTVNIIALCEQLNINAIIFTSTMMVYQAGEIERTETSITAPDTAYGISKLLAEMKLTNWMDRKGGRQLKIIRPAVVFGQNENANFTRLYKSLKGGFFPYVGKSTTVKSSIYVKELTNFIQFLMEKNTNRNIFNLGFPENLTIKNTVKTFKKVFNFKAYNPVIPYSLLLFTSKLFEILNAIGLKNPIHHRRIQKLYFSTNIFPQSALEEKYNFKFTLETALEDWKRSSDSNL